jgi:hypothetical protein
MWVQHLFPEVVIARLPGKLRPVLKLSDEIRVCIRVCVARRVGKSVVWDFTTNRAEEPFCTLLARANVNANGFHSLYVMPPRKWASFYRFTGTPSWLREGIRLRALSDLRQAVNLVGKAVA